MTTRDSAHLSEEAFDDLLIGLGNPASEAHLAGCESCRKRVEEFRSHMQAFNQASMAWSEAQPFNRSRFSSGIKVRRALQAPLIWALTAALLLGIGLPMWYHEHRSYIKHSMVTDSENSPEQIAQDNALMRSVNAVLSEPVESPIREYNLTGGAQQLLNQRPESRNR